MDLERPGDLPTEPAPDMDSRDGGQERKGPAVSYATASGTTRLPAQPQKSSVSDGHRPESSGRAFSKSTRSTPNCASASPLTSTFQLGHRQKQVWRTRDVEKASRLERKPPEFLASWDSSLSRARQVNSKSPTCVDPAPSTVSGGGDKVKSMTLLLDASSSSASAEAAMTSTPIADETSETRTLPTEPLIKRRSLEEPTRKKPSGVSTRRSSRGRPALKTSESKLSGELGATCGRDCGERLGESSTVKSEDDERPKTSLLRGVTSSLGTFLGKIIGRPSYGRVPKPEASSPEEATAIGESSRKRKPHGYVSRQTGRGIGVVNKILPLTAERLPIQTAMQRSSKISQNVAADPVAAHEGWSRRSQAVSKCAELKAEKVEQVQGSFPLDNTTTEFSFTGFSFADGRGDVQRQRRQQSLPPACGVHGSKAAIPLCHTVTVVTTAHESPGKRGHGKKKSKESKKHRDNRQDDGDARARKSKSFSKRHNHERGGRGDRKRSSRASNGEERKRKDKTEDSADIFDEPDGSTYEVGSPMASREFSFEIAMVPFTRGALPRPELTRPSKHRFNSNQWRESTTSRVTHAYESSISPRSVEATSPASPVSPGSPPSPLSPASQDRRASPADGTDTSPLINQETRSELRAHPRMDDSPSTAGESRKKAREKTSHRKSRSKHRSHREKSKRGAKPGHDRKSKRSRLGQRHEGELSPPAETSPSTPAKESHVKTSHRKSRSKRSHKPKSKHGSKHKHHGLKHSHHASEHGSEHRLHGSDHGLEHQYHSPEHGWEHKHRSSKRGSEHGSEHKHYGSECKLHGHRQHGSEHGSEYRHHGSGHGRHDSEHRHHGSGERSRSSRKPGKTSSGGRNKQRRERHGRKKKKYSPIGAPARGDGTGAYVFEWRTSEIPSVAGVPLIWSTTYLHDSSGPPSPRVLSTTRSPSAMSSDFSGNGAHKRDRQSSRKRHGERERSSSKRRRRGKSHHHGKGESRNRKSRGDERDHERRRRHRPDHGERKGRKHHRDRHRSKRKREKEMSPHEVASPEGLAGAVSSPTDTMSRYPDPTQYAHVEKRSPTPSAKSQHRTKKGKGDGSPTQSHSSMRSKQRSRSKSRKSRGKKFDGDDSLSPTASFHVSSGSKKLRKKSRKRHKSRRSRESMRSRRVGSRSKSKEGRTQAGGGDLVEKRDSKSPDRKSPEGAISTEERSESRASKKSRSRHGKSRKRRGKGRRKGKSRSKSNRKSRKSEESPEVGGSSKRSRESVSPERWSEMRVSKGTKRSKRSRSRDGRKSRSRSSRKSKSSRHSRRKHGRHSRHGRRRKRHRGKRSRGKSRSPRSSGRKSRSHAKRSRRTKHRKRHGTSRKRSHSTRASEKRRLHGGKKATEQVGYAGGYACYCLAFAIFAMLILIVCALAAYYTCIIRPKSDSTSTATSKGTGHTGSSSRSTRKHRTRPSPRTTTKPLEPYYCTSSYCKREGQYIGTLLSATTSPCDDFYDHVCTTWVSQHPARSTSTGSLVSQDTMIQMALTRHLLDQLKSAKSRHDIGVAAELHSDCVDRIASIPPAAESLNSLFSKWSITSWPRGDALHDGEVAVWRFAAELARDFDLATISRVGVSVNPDNLDETVVTLELPRFLLSEADHAKGDAAELFNQAVAEVVGELKASVVGDFAQRLFMVRSAFANVKSLSRNGEDELVVRFDKLSEGLRAFLTVLLSDMPRQLTSETNVLLRSEAYFQRDIHGILRSFPFEDTVNYFGFLVIIHLAPFLSHDMRSLRNLFADTVLGHTLGDVAADTPFLCTWLIDQVLPDCVAKAIGMWRHSEGRDVVTREWLDQLEMVFLKRVTDLPWIGELSALLVRYRLKRRSTIQVGPSMKLDCARGLTPAGSNPILVFWNVSKQRQYKTLRGLSMRGHRLRNRVWGSGHTDLSVEASFRRDFQMVHVPAAIFNDSVPTGSSIFIFQLARVAVRFYRALAQFLHENSYEREAPLSFAEDYGHRLAEILDCIREQALDPGALLSARAILDRTTALLMAVNAFDQLLPIRRIWRLDLRLENLPDVTAHQLFFIYFALDNCESRDPAFHHGRISAKQAVNVPLKHLSQFAEAFKCSPGAPMAGLDCMLDFRRRRSAAKMTWIDQESDGDAI